MIGKNSDRRYLAHDQAPLEEARVVFAPLPFEGTVSYMKGTAQAPEKIIEASQQLELFEEECEWEPTAVLPLHTLDPLIAAQDEPPESYLYRMERVLAAVPEGAFVIGLGGEHTVSAPLVRRCLPESGTVVVIDAHPDMRAEYEGSELSHACAMRKLAEDGYQVVQIGLGCNTPEEAQFVRASPNVEQYPSRMISSPGGFSSLLDRLSALEGEAYLSVDVDGLCTSIMPGTGTPVPGGLTWRELMEVLRRLWGNEKLEIKGMDVVEVRPLPGNPLSEFTAAKLIHKCLSMGFKRSAGS